MKKIKFDTKTLRRVFRDLKHHRTALIFSLLLAAINVALTLYIPYLTGQAIDLIVGKGQVAFSGVIQISVFIGIAAVISALAQWLMSLVNNRITYSMVKQGLANAVKECVSKPHNQRFIQFAVPYMRKAIEEAITANNE